MPRQAAWGRVEIKEDPGHEPLVYYNRSQADVTSKLCIWWPGKALQRQKQLLDSFAVALRCATTADGERRFSPIGRGDRSVDPFLFFYARAFACGLAILCKSHKMTKRQRTSYRAMFFLFQRAQKMRQHIRRVFKSKKDLIIARSGHDIKDESERHVLPWEFNVTTKMAGYPQSVAELLERGSEAARKAGISRPNAEQKIHYGMADVARIDRMPLGSDGAARFIKSVLFDIDTNWEPLAPEIMAIVEDRVFSAIWPHLDADTVMFNDWFWGRHNSFIKQIAQQKKGPGGELDPEVVERYLLQKGWEAYEYVGHCVRAWANEMLEAMPEPLTKSELNAFAGLYFCLSEFGGIPLILLAEKLQFVAPVLEDIINNPGKERPVQVFYRLLQFYSTMVSNRRKADVGIKKAAKKARKWLQKEAGQEASIDVVPNKWKPSAKRDDRVDDRDQLEAYYARVAKVKGLTCNCRKPKWDVQLEEVEDTHDFRLTFTCAKCETTQSVTILAAEL